MNDSDIPYWLQNVIASELPMDGNPKPGYGPREMNLARVQWEFDHCPYELARQARTLEEARALRLKEEWIERQREIESRKKFDARYDAERRRADAASQLRIRRVATFSKDKLDEICAKVQADIDSRPPGLCNCAQLNRITGDVRICDKPRFHGDDHRDSARNESWKVSPLDTWIKEAEASVE